MAVVLASVPRYDLNKLFKIRSNGRAGAARTGVRVTGHRDENIGAHGPVYRSIERALWALGAALFLFLLLSYPSLQALRQEAATQIDMAIAAENADYCSKWGMPAGSPQHLGCLQDLAAIRARSEQRLRDEIASDF